MTPIVLALLLNEPGGVAEMDENYQYLEDWVAIACADNSIKTRVTALQALGGYLPESDSRRTFGHRRKSSSCV